MYLSTRGKILVGLVIGCMLLFAGAICANTYLSFNNPPQARGTNPTATANATEANATTTPGTSVDGNGIIYAKTSNSISKIETGKQKALWTWKQETELLGDPIINNRFVYQQSIDYNNDGQSLTIVALDATSGKVVWQASFDILNAWTLSADGNHIYVLHGSTLTQLDAATGDERWKQEFTINNTSINIDSYIFVPSGETIYLALGPDVYALNAANGSERWQTPEALREYGTRFAQLDGETLIFISDPGGAELEVEGIAIDNGEVRWEHALPIMDNTCNLQQQKHQLSCFYMAANTNYGLLTLNITDGAIVLEREYDFGNSEFFITANTAYRSYVEDNVYAIEAFDLQTGDSLWNEQVVKPSDGAGAGAELDRVTAIRDNGQSTFIQTANNNLYTFKHESGSSQWSQRSVYSALLIEDGSLYLVTVDVDGYAIRQCNDKGNVSSWSQKIPEPKDEAQRIFLYYMGS